MLPLENSFNPTCSSLGNLPFYELLFSFYSNLIDKKNVEYKWKKRKRKDGKKKILNVSNISRRGLILCRSGFHIKERLGAPNKFISPNFVYFLYLKIK